MKQILFIQDAGKDVHEKWDNKLVESLRRELGPGYEVRLPSDVPVFLYHGGKDETAPIAHVAWYAEAIPRARVRRLANRDHQLNNDLSEVARGIRELAVLPR